MKAFQVEIGKYAHSFIICTIPVIFISDTENTENQVNFLLYTCTIFYQTHLYFIFILLIYLFLLNYEGQCLLPVKGPVLFLQMNSIYLLLKSTHEIVVLK